MPNKIIEAFNKKNNHANIGFIVAGYPSINFTSSFLKSLDDTSIDILEIGIPYSDPIADGKSISEASFKACQDGVTTDTVFETLISEKDNINKPLVFLVYYNLVFAYGIDNFIKKSVETNISGIIIPDLPYEEAEEFVAKLRNANISFIPLVSVTSENRIPKLVSQGDGFIYAIGSLGVTGTKPVSLDRLEGFVKEIREHTNLPIALGFGIKSNDDVNVLRDYADGVIVGTSIVNLTTTNDLELTVKGVNDLFK